MTVTKKNLSGPRVAECYAIFTHTKEQLRNIYHWRIYSRRFSAARRGFRRGYHHSIGGHQPGHNDRNKHCHDQLYPEVTDGRILAWYVPS